MASGARRRRRRPRGSLGGGAQASRRALGLTRGHAADRPPRAPHPGAQLSFCDRDGHRFTCFLTDQDDADVAALELRHRRRARVEDRIRCAKQAGLDKLPFHAFAHNEVWLELVLIAHDVLAWAAQLTLDGELRLAEPKRLRHRLLHTAGRLVRSGRRRRLRLARDWP